MKRLALYLCFGLAVSLVGAVSAGAQTASTFHKFSGGSAGDGDEPTVLIQAQDGNFYGITSYGGNSSGCTNDQGNPTGCGTIFRISSSGTETVLYKFPGAVGGKTSGNSLWRDSFKLGSGGLTETSMARQSLEGWLDPDSFMCGWLRNGCPLLR